MITISIEGMKISIDNIKSQEEYRKGLYTIYDDIHEMISKCNTYSDIRNQNDKCIKLLEEFGKTKIKKEYRFEINKNSFGQPLGLAISNEPIGKDKTYKVQIFNVQTLSGFGKGKLRVLCCATGLVKSTNSKNNEKSANTSIPGMNFIKNHLDEFKCITNLCNIYKSLIKDAFKKYSSPETIAILNKHNWFGGKISEKDVIKEYLKNIDFWDENDFSKSTICLYDDAWDDYLNDETDDDQESYFGVIEKVSLNALTNNPEYKKFKNSFKITEIGLCITSYHYIGLTIEFK